MTSHDTAPIAPRGLRLRTILTALGIGGLLYVGAAGLVIAVKLGPETRRLQQRSTAVLDEFRDSRLRASMLDVTMTDLWRLLGETRVAGAPRPVDTLEHYRIRVQQLLDAPRASIAAGWPDGVPRELQRVLSNATGHEEILGSALLAAIAGLQLGDIAATAAFMMRADSLDTPLAASLSQATTLALRDVTDHEIDLAQTAANTARFIGIWFALGVLLLPLLGVLMHNRLYGPLALLDRGLSRIADGDLSVRLPTGRSDELGRVSALFNQMADLLRQRADDEAERVTIRSAARTRRIVEAALDAVIVFDARGVVREWSPMAESVFGWSRAEVIDHDVVSLIVPPTLRDQIRIEFAEFRYSLETGMLNRRVETSMVRRDGTVFPVELAITLIDQTEGRLEVSMFVRDITERQRAQAALMASETRFRSAFDESAVGMLEFDSNGRCRRANRAFGAIVGYTPEELKGQSSEMVTPPEDHGTDRGVLHRLFVEQVPVVRHDKRYRRRDGSIAWANVTVSVMRAPDVVTPYAVAVVQDVTVRRRLEEELRQSQKMEAIGQLAGGVAHDFNNLLTAIVGHAHLLRDARGPELVGQHAEAIEHAASRAADLTRSLLAFARRSPMRRESLDLHEVTRDVVALLGRTVDRRIDIRLQLDDPHPIVLGDRTQLVNAVLNVALNARDAMPAGGTLTISSARAVADSSYSARHPGAVAGDTYVVITIRDTGTGMTQDTASHIFEPFFTTKATSEGTGLGLAMVYGSVRSHEGHLIVESAMGEGTSISMALPHADAESVPAQPTTPTVVRGTGRVLLADDEPAVLDVGVRILRRLGYVVETATNGAEAVERVRTTAERFDVIILDGNMPVMTGPEACRRIHDIDSTIPVVLASGYVADDADSAHGGFAAVVQKPYSVAELSQVVAKLVKRG